MCTFFHKKKRDFQTVVLNSNLLKFIQKLSLRPGSFFEHKCRCPESPCRSDIWY